MSKGFTLIELLIVLAVIAALLAIVTPIALNAVAQAKATQVAANFRNIRSALESYVYTQRSTPTNLDALVSNGYLNNKPDSFSIQYEAGSSSADKFVYKIKYTGSVDTTKLFSILPEATGTAGDITLTVTLAAWW
ncbi:hypothetical protein AS159_08615 [Thermotoga sp. Ku-13t]|nr:hypothetical protein AS159_08615 [Thermotoga sp. Ku-13t]